MRNATLVLMTIVIACCLIVSQEALADGRYSLTGPVEFVGQDRNGLLNNMAMVPTDPFFDVFADVPSGGARYPADSFFDVFVELSVDGGRFSIDSFFDVFVDVTPTTTDGLFDTEIVSMSLSGNAPGIPEILVQGTSAGTGSTRLTQLPSGDFAVDSFFDITYMIDFDGSGPLEPVDGGLLGGPTPGPVRMRTYPNGVPTPREVPGKEYSHHADIDAPAVLDPMQNLAWDGTGNAWDTFDYSGVAGVDWRQGTNVDAIANIQDRLFKEVVEDKVALLATIDEGTSSKAAAPGDYENIHYQTAGAGSVAGIWAQGVIPGAPPTSQIHTAAVQAREIADPEHLSSWLNPTGIEVWGREVSPPPDGGGPGTGDDAIMFSTNSDWAWDPTGLKWIAQPAVWKYDPATHSAFSYIMANQIRDAIDNAALQLVENDIPVDLDGMMIFDAEKDDIFGPGDSILFTVHSVPGTTGGFILDGGEIWVWNFDDGPFGSAQFLNHGGFIWDTANSITGIFPNVFTEENIGGLEAVPEPATMTLLALGGLAVLRRRRRRA